MRYLSPPLIKRSILFSSTTLQMTDMLKTQETTVLSCVAPRSHSDPVYVINLVCIPGHIWWFGLCASLSCQPGRAVATFELPWVTPGTWKNGTVFLQQRWNYRVQNREQHLWFEENLLHSAFFHAKISNWYFRGDYIKEKANGCFSCSCWPTRTSRRVGLLE